MLGTKFSQLYVTACIRHLTAKLFHCFTQLMIVVNFREYLHGVAYRAPLVSCECTYLSVEISEYSHTSSLAALLSFDSPNKFIEPNWGLRQHSSGRCPAS